MKSILVTNTGNQTHAAALAARPDLQVTFITEARLNMYPPGTDILVVEDLNDPSGTAKAVLEQRNCDHYEAVVSLSERAAQSGAYLRDYLGLKGPSFSAVNNSTNKYAMKRRFAAVGLPTAPFALANSADAVEEAGCSIGWPVIVKPVLGAGTDATRVFADEAELDSPEGREFFHRLHEPATTSEKQFPVIVEKFLDVKAELHCDGFVKNGRIVYARVSTYLRPVLNYATGVFGSYTLPGNDPVAAAALKMHEQAVKAIGLEDGVTHFELFETAEGLLAGEIASRPGGGGIRRMLQLQSGFDTWAAHIAVSLGETYEWEASEGGEAQIAQLMLPAKRGAVRAISTAEDFANVPGLLEADIRLKPGDVVDGLMDSSTISGFLFVRIDDQQGLARVIEAVNQAFFIEVE